MATGDWAAVVEGGLGVSWRGESGRGESVTPLSTSQARQMLCHAGAVAPYPLVRLQEMAFAGRWVRVYCVLVDRCFTGVVTGYDHASQEHVIEYDDGDVVSELVGDLAAFAVLD